MHAELETLQYTKLSYKESRGYVLDTESSLCSRGKLTA